MCHGAHMEVGGQPSDISSSLPLCRVWGLSSGIMIGGKHLYLAILHPSFLNPSFFHNILMEWKLC